MGFWYHNTLGTSYFYKQPIIPVLISNLNKPLIQEPTEPKMYPARVAAWSPVGTIEITNEVDPFVSTVSAELILTNIDTCPLCHNGSSVDPAVGENICNQ